LKDKKEPPPGLLVNACTICCGAGVAGVAVNAGKSSIGETNTKGQCSLPNVVETECLKCEVSHTAMGIVPHKISMNGPTELPLFFKSKVYVYVVDGNEGSLGPKLVYLTAHVSQVPKNAKPFQGRVTTDVGDVPLPEPPSTGALPIELPPEQVPGKVCPIGALTFLPAQAGFKWCPLGTSNWPPPRESCGMQSLLSEGAILLGSLKPFATIKHISGQEYVFPLDEFATVGAAKAHLAKELDVSMGNLKVGLKDGVALKDDIPTTYGLALQVLCYLTVRITFGSSDVGMPDVLIKAEGHEKKYKTDPNGMVEILAGCGTQNLVLSHPCFGEEKTSVELTEHQQKWSHATDVTLYAYVTDPEVKKPVSAIEVWLCAQRGQIPAAARKWEGKVSVPPEQLVNVVIGDKSAAITITNKEDASATGELPVSWLSLDCKEDGYDWFSKEEKLMDTKAIWAEIIQMPINVGVLKPSIKVTNCDGQELSVPVDEATSGLGVRTYLAKKLGVPLEVIQVSGDKEILSDDQVISPGMVLNVLSQLTVRVTCGLSNVGVPGVDVVLDGGVNVKTGDDGAIPLMATRGKHSLSVSHPIFGEEDAMIELGKLQESWCFATEVSLFTFAVDPVAGKEMDPVEVYFCAQKAHVPRTSRPVHGNGKVTLTSGKDLLFTIDQKTTEVKIPQEESETLPGAPLRGLSLQCAEEGFQWFPDESLVLGMQKSWEEVVRGPVCVGLLKPSAEVKMHTGDTYNLAVAELGNVKLAREYLAKELKRSVEDVALFLDGNQLADNYQLVPKSKLTGSLLAEVTFQIFVPEGVKETKDREPLPDVYVLVDGISVAKTGVTGAVTLSTTIGNHDFRLMHPALGHQGRSLGVMDITLSPLKKEILCDVRLYAYMTEPEPDSDGAAEQEADAAPFYMPSLVWICGSFDQIPDDAKSVDGRIWGTGVGGKEVSAELGLTANPTEFILAAGVDLEAVTSENMNLASLCVQCFKADYVWRPKDPSPLAERAQEIGGSEYLRLLQCPVVLGNLLPAFRVHTLEGEIHELSCQNFPTVRDCRETMAHLMGFPVEQLRILFNKKQLKDEAFMSHGMDVDIRPLDKLMVRVSSACCGEAFDGVEVTVDGELHGCTLGGGLEIATTVGSHTVVLSHPVYPVFGEQGIVKSVEVLYQEKNEISVFAECRMFAYVTEPEPIDEEDQEETGDFGPIFDPSCVWLAANQMHIPDDSLPINSSIKAQAATGEDIEIYLDPEKVKSFVLELTPYGKTMQDISPPPPGALPQCPLSSVTLNGCTRPGFKWSPKDPSPLVERTAEISGCEYMRVLNCPVVFGWLKPSVCVQCKEGEHFELPMDTYNEVAVIIDHLADELGLDDASSLTLYNEDGSQVTSKRVDPGSTYLLCKGNDKVGDVAKALEAHQKEFDAEEAEKAQKLKLQQETEKRKAAEAAAAAAAQAKAASPEAVEVEAYELQPENITCEVNGGLVGMAIRYPTPLETSSTQ
jgi:hypothetical protein